MTKLGSIVVGTDGSERADRAVARAGEIAHAVGVTVHVVSGYSNSTAWVAATGTLAPAEVFDEEEKRTRAQEYVDQAQLRLSELGVASETHVCNGEAADALVRIADEHDAQMIVVGNRGMTGKRRVLGSVPNRVSHRASCDVLIVPTS